MSRPGSSAHRKQKSLPEESELPEEQEKRHTPMQTSPQVVSNSVHRPSDTPNGARTHADLIYQVVTIAAVLLLLGSLWVF
jgi:hypothetical protein